MRGSLLRVAVVGWCVAVGIALHASPQAAGSQTQATPPAPTNLQVLPKLLGKPTLTIEQILPMMKGLSMALGVTCAHCHVFVAPNSPMNDFASDAKAEKKTARMMMLLTAEINQKLQAGLGKPAGSAMQVHCATCHRGMPTPPGV